MAKIRMIQTAAGPNGPFVAGREYNVPGEVGTQYVSAGAATWVQEPIERAVETAPETRKTTSTVDLRNLRKVELQEMAAERGVKVTRADGEDGHPLKSDYVRALSA